MKISAGLSIICNGKILLVHPTNAGWWTSLSIPKGKVEDGETYLQAALRETMEEVGIEIPDEIVHADELMVRYRRKKKNGGSGKTYKKVFHFLVQIDDLSQIGLDSEKIPKEQLELDEVDWAGFFELDEAKKRLSKNMKPIIDQIQEILD